MDKGLRACATIESLELRRLLTANPFVHPGILNTAADFTRMQTEVAANAQPWLADWQLLQSQGYAQLGASPRPLATVIRGGTGENFAQMYIDIERAYDTALEWKVTGNTAYANQTVTFLNAWSSTMTSLTGDADRFLASGLYGFQWANIAEIMRTYSGWAAADQTKFQNYLLNIYYPMNADFLANHNTAYITNYWANWDLCNIASEMAIGIFCDRQDIYAAALNYIYTGAGNGAFDKAVYYIQSGNLGQGQEEGRDQGHSNLDFALMGEICQMAWNQGDDLFSYHDNEFLAATEYLAKYNLGNSVPYEPYEWGNGQSGTWSQQAGVSDASQGQLRPIFELVYNHYVNIEGLSAPYTAQALAITRPEGDNGNGDEYSWGTLIFTLPPITTPQPPQDLVGYEKGTGNIELDWWGGANDTSYNIYRATSSSGPFTKIASGITVFTYTDTNLPGGNYYYMVTGVDGSTETPASNVVMATSTSLLIAELTFNQSSGTTATDSIADGVTGTLNGGATFTTGMSGGNAVSLNGSTGYVSLPAAAIYNLSDFTIATWVNLSSSQTWARIFDFGDDRGDYMFLTPRNNNGVVQFSTTTVYGYNGQNVVGTAALPTNQWVNVAVTFSNRVATIYVNGIAVASNANMDFPPYEINGGMPNSWIGRSQFPADPYLNGKIEDFRIYRGALPAGQIYMLATGKAPPATLAAPSSFTATAVAGNQINLSWGAVTGSTSYTLLRSNTSGGTYVPLATLVHSTTYSDTGLIAGATYYYVVDTANNGGDGALSAESHAVALPPLPSVPTTLAAQAASSSSIALSWAAAANDSTYTIRRGSTPGGPYTTLVVTGVTATTYTDTGRITGTTYYYVVDADNASGESVNSNQASAIASDLEAHLRFNDGSGSIATDSSGNNWNGTLVNSPTWNTTGPLNGGLTLTGASSQYVTLPTGVVGGLTSFTVSAWVNLASVGQWMRIFDFGTGTTDYMYLSPKGASNVVGFAINAGGGEQQINGTAALPVGTWTNVAVTWSANVGRLYVNGTQVGINSNMTLNPSSLGSTTLNYIGKSQFNDPYLNGTVDDFRVFVRALSAAEISTLAHGSVPSTVTGVAVMNGNAQATLSWNASSGASTYDVKRSLTSGGPYAVIASNVSGTGYVDTNLTNGVTYYYVVSAVNIIAEAADSTQISAVPDAPPVVVTPASASPNPVTGSTALLSVLGGDDLGESSLSYTWSVVGTPPLGVTFSPNGTSAAKNTTASFAAIGTYTLMVTITNPASLTVTSTVNVTVNTILGTASNDSIRLVRSGANMVVYTNGSSYSVPYASLGAITVMGGAGTDTVNVDFSGGATPVPAAGLNINGSGGMDTLIITGTTGADTASINSNTFAFDSSTINYTNIQSIIINGNGGSDSLTQTAQPGAALAFNGGVGGGTSATDSLAIDGGSFTFPAPTSGQGILPLSLSSLAIGSGASVALPDAAAHMDRWLLDVNSLSVAGKLDLGGNDLIVHNANLGTLTSQIASAGIISSTVASDPTFLTTLGAIAGTGGTFDGQSTVATDVLVKFTYYGDADLTGSVDGSDYSRIDNGYLNHLSGWYNGDFNYDGVVNGSDYTLIDNAFNQQDAQLAAQIAVPLFSNSPIAAPSSQNTEGGAAWTGSDTDSLESAKRKKHDLFQNNDPALGDTL